MEGNKEELKLKIVCDVSEIQKCFKKYPREERKEKCAAEIEAYKIKCSDPNLFTKPKKYDQTKI